MTKPLFKKTIAEDFRDPEKNPQYFLELWKRLAKRYPKTNWQELSLEEVTILSEHEEGRADFANLLMALANIDKNFKQVIPESIVRDVRNGVMRALGLYTKKATPVA